MDLRTRMFFIKIRTIKAKRKIKQSIKYITSVLLSLALIAGF